MKLTAAALAKLRVAAYGLLAAGLLQHSALAADDVYRLTEVRGLTPNTPVFLHRLNNLGEIIGSSEDAEGNPRPTFWNHFVPTNLYQAYHQQIDGVMGINDRSELCGVGGGFARAYILKGGKLQFLAGPQLNGFPAMAWGLNNRGEVAVLRTTPTPSTDVVRWLAGTTTQFAYGPFMDIAAINNAGAISGWSSDTLGNHAFVWAKGVLTKITPLPVERKDLTFVADMNDHGQVVGLSGGRNFLWEDGVTSDLQFGLPGTTVSTLTAINNPGVVVGATRVSITTDPLNRAVIWREGVTRDLNTLISANDPLKKRVILTDAVDINDQGEILAHGTDLVDHRPDHAYFLRPTSLPNVNP